MDKSGNDDKLIDALRAELKNRGTAVQVDPRLIPG
jgi:hypothetical protein